MEAQHKENVVCPYCGNIGAWVLHYIDGDQRKCTKCGVNHYVPDFIVSYVMFDQMEINRRNMHENS